MVTIYREITDPQEWNDVLAALPNAHVLQSWPWGQFKSRWGWQAARLLWRDGDAPAAAAQVLARQIPRAPWRFLYVSKGPALDWRNPALAARVLLDLERYAAAQNALFIKIDPDVALYRGDPEQASPVAEGWIVRELLTRRGWQFSPEQIQFRNTVIIDLTPSEADLLAAMKSKWRYNIRLAGRKGVTIQPGTGSDLPQFFQMYAETAARDGFLIRPEAYYRQVWQHFLQTGQADLLLASVAGEPVAGLLLFYFGRTAWYLYGASTGQHRNLMPNHALQWAAIKQAKRRGCTRYDLWGAPDHFDESDRLWGVYRFKQGFCGQVLLGLGAYDFPVNRPLYWAFSAALPRVRRWLRRLR